MKLSEKVTAAIKEAMKNKEKEKLTPLRAIKAAITMALTEKGAGDELTEEKEISILQKMIKQRSDSLKIYTEQGRGDLAENEEKEIAVIKEFLPEQMSEEEVKAAVMEIIAKTGAESMKDMGKVMGMAGQAIGGKADKSLIARLVKEQLG